jgi:hypothetical protein
MLVPSGKRVARATLVNRRGLAKCGPNRYGAAFAATISRRTSWNTA